MGRDLQLPSGAEPTAAAVVLHPHPAMGGHRDHPLVVAVAEGLAAGGVAALRADLRDPDVAVSADALEEVAAGLLADLGVGRLPEIASSSRQAGIWPCWGRRNLTAGVA